MRPGRNLGSEAWTDQAQREIGFRLGGANISCPDLARAGDLASRIPDQRDSRDPGRQHFWRRSQFPGAAPANRFGRSKLLDQINIVVCGIANDDELLYSGGSRECVLR